jgi:phosphoadenosine phosphosulfate reductase
MSNIYWCSECNSPLLSQKCSSCGSLGGRIASDIRPIFPDEKRLWEVLLGYPNGYFNNAFMWDTKSNKLIIDGKPFPIKKGELQEKEPKAIAQKLSSNITSPSDLQHFSANVKTFIECNESRLYNIENEAFDSIKQSRIGREHYLPIVSFSGGKDSTVVSDLVRRAYANQSIIHVFGNTTLEFHDTIEYIAEFKKENPRTPFFECKSDHNFKSLCDKIGPPSRVMRWCCTVFKTGPIGEIFDGLGKTQKMLTYYGIRHAESGRRAKYDKGTTKSPKISQQVVSSPVICWLDADIWLYLFSRNISFNNAYQKGFSRVGCWACPSNSLWSWFLTRIYYPQLSEPWRNYLIGMAKTIGKPDPEEYVDSGNWKARQGGQGLKTAYKGIVTSKPCGDDPDAQTFTLTRPISPELYEYFKPFGRLEFGRGRSFLGEVFILNKKTKDPILVLQGKTDSTELRVKVIDSNNPTLLLQRAGCQLRKYQACILCNGCPSCCPAGAIYYNTDQYKIDEDKCTNCLKCITHFDTGCLVSKVLVTKRS